MIKLGPNVGVGQERTVECYEQSCGSIGVKILAQPILK
jgi:hypothetical protein